MNIPTKFNLWIDVIIEKAYISAGLYKSRNLPIGGAIIQGKSKKLAHCPVVLPLGPIMSFRKDFSVTVKTVL